MNASYADSWRASMARGAFHTICSTERWPPCQARSAPDPRVPLLDRLVGRGDGLVQRPPDAVVHVVQPLRERVARVQHPETEDALLRSREAVVRSARDQRRIVLATRAARERVASDRKKR